MMPLAPHLLLPAVGHMTAATTTANSTTSSSKPKLTFSIDSIVGRNTIETHKRTQDNNKLKQIPATAQQTIEYSPINRIETTSPPLLIQRTKQNKMSTALNQLSPSPLSTPSPILSVPNVPKSIPYIDQNASNSHQNQQQTHHHLNHHSSIGLIGSQPHPTSALSHSLMMAAAHHMPPIPQEYHQAVALYPWLLRANPFVNRFPGVPFDGSLSSFLLPPFRKPKRIRTAFSPGQLLKLEQAFEKNHYVVGNERKQLANNLGLSETQVKVWFQNRRTKHKRQKQEEDDQQTGTNTGSSDSNKTLSCAKDNNCVNTDEEEEDDEDIDLEDDDIDSDADNDIINCDVRHHVWYQSMPSAATSQKSSIESSIASTSTSIKI